MKLTHLIVAGAVAAIATVALPEDGHARFGPVDGLSEHTAGPVQKVGGFHYRYGHVHGRRYYGHRGYRYRGYRRYGHRYRYGPRFYGGVVIGAPFAFGVYRGGYYPHDGYRSRAYRHRPARRYRGGHEPWSAAWLASCSARYRTFNPRTGSYFYKPGRQRFCR